MDHGLPDCTINTVISIFSKFSSIKSAILYGSRAKGTYKPGSDIDIALITDNSFTHEGLLQLMHCFDESDLPYLVDIADYSSIINPDLKDHIDRVGQIIYERNDSGKVSENR